MYTTKRSKAPTCTCTQQQKVPHTMYMYTTARGKAPGCTTTRQQEAKHQNVHVQDSKK